MADLLAWDEVIYVMGMSGSGKAEFLRNIADGGIECVRRDEGPNILCASKMYNGRKVRLIALPGPAWPDSRKFGVEDVITDNASCFEEEVRRQRGRNPPRVSGLVYLHPVDDKGLSYHAHRYINVFQRLVGEAAFSQVVLATSCWRFIDVATGLRRQQVLQATLWAGMIESGAETLEFHSNRESANRILDQLLGQETWLESTVVLTIQRELRQGLKLEDTNVMKRGGQGLRNMTDERYTKLLGAMWTEHVLASEKGDEGLITPLRDRIVGLRRILNGRTKTRRVSPAEGNVDSLYNPLQPGQIRVVNLEAGTRDEQVRIQLTVENLEEKPQYEALSYVVGKSDLTGAVRISSRPGFKLLKVSQNLQQILSALRWSEEDGRHRRLWVDALSINQENEEERSAQIRLMSQIFRSAENVCIWLGPARDGSDDAMRFIDEIVDFRTLDKLVANSERNKDWTDLAGLLGRDWFRRRWVVQEMALARKATVHCGDKQVDWSKFNDAAAIYGARWLEVIQTRGQTDMFELGEVPAPGAASLVNISSNVFRKNRSGAIQERLLNIESLLSRLPMFEVTDIRDSFYAVMDLASDTYGTTEIPVDYRSSPAELFSAVLKVAITTSGSLDIICRPWVPVRKENLPSDASSLPSWIRTISDYAYSRRPDQYFDRSRPDGQYDRLNADSLVGIPDQRRYSAAGDTKTREIKLDSMTLTCQGFQIGTITVTGAQSQNGNIPGDWLTIGEWPSSATDTNQSFWRTLVADRTPDGSNPPSWYARAFEYSFSQRSTNSVDTKELIRRSKYSGNVQDFLRKVQATIWDRVLFKMDVGHAHSVDFTGLGPGTAKTGDIICILFGCSVPVVLRVYGGNYILVGECFVYGMMEGQGLKGLQSGRYRERTFLIT